MVQSHFVVYYEVRKDTYYEEHSVTAATIMGVAEIVTKLHKANTPAKRWEKVVRAAPTADEQKALRTFLGFVGVPTPET